MGDIYFDLHSSDDLAGMTPQPMPGGGFTNAALPPGLHGGGLYIIYNHLTNNRYIGISVDLANRFGGRMSVITELGFDHHTMSNILIWWGRAGVKNTGALGNPNWLPNYNGPLVAPVDGVNINLEHLLIRYVLNWLAPGTVSNNIFASQPITNNTGRTVEIYFHSCQNPVFAAYNHQLHWLAGHQI